MNRLRSLTSAAIVGTVVWATAVVGLHGPALAAGTSSSTVVVRVAVDGNDVHKDNVNGLTYKGLGLLSGNSTSNLLMDYKAEHPRRYWQLIDVLFGGENPLITHVKMEMGADTNNSTGAEPATMRTADELADASRSPGFQLAADAKTVNPRLMVSFLRWTMPQWVQTAWNAGPATGYPAMYKWYKETILDAYQKYGYMIDYVDPDTNETSNPDEAFIKWYQHAIASDTDFSDPRYGIPEREQQTVAQAYHRIRIVASDENTSKNIGPAMLSDADLFAAVAAVGYHYTTDDNAAGSYSKLATGQTATGDDKEVWYSEGVGSFGFTDYRVNNTEGPGGASTGIGGVQSALDVANRLVKSYANSKRTHYIFQPAIGSFYEGAQYSHKELLSARDPWSGYIHYDAAIYVMEQFTRFATMGWENAENTAGIWRSVPEASYSGVSGTENLDGSNGAPSYLTLAAPDKSDFSTVIVNDSDQRKTYAISAENMDLGTDLTGEVWESRAADSGQDYDANFLHLVNQLQPEDGTYRFTVAPRSIVTFTTLDKSSDPTMEQRLPGSGERTVLDTTPTGRGHDAGDGVLYADDFEYRQEPGVQVGVDDGSRKVHQSYLESRGDQPRYMVDQTGAWEVGADTSHNHVLYQRMDQSMKNTGAWNPGTPNTLVGDFRWQNYTATVDVSFPDPQGGQASLGVRQETGMTADSAAYVLKVDRTGAWKLARHSTVVAGGTVPAADAYTLAVQAAGSTITAFIDGAKVAGYHDPNPEVAGRVNLGSGFNVTGFDNLRIDTVPGYTPYASSLVDNMDASVSYDGAWARKAANGSANDWYRTTSTSSTAGASFTVPFEGTGIDLIGANDGTATVDVTVDGQPLARGAATRATDSRQATYRLQGLTDGKHVATLTVRSGKLVLDGVSVVSAGVSGRVDTTPVRQALASVGEPDAADYSTGSWAVFRATRDAAAAAVRGQRGLDVMGVAELADRLEAAYDQLVPPDLTDEQVDLGLKGALTTDGALPGSLDIGGVTHAVTWTGTSRKATRTTYATLTVTGWTNDAYVDGKKQAFSASFEIVPPGLTYYVDSGLASGQTSPQYDAVKGSFDLANDTADQVSSGADVWGRVADGLNVKAGTDPADKYSTGLWAGSGKTVRYRLPLQPGDYVLTAGFTEWWGQTRPMSQSVTVGTQTVAGTPVNLTLGARLTGTVSFTVTTPTTVTYTVAKTGSQDPVISWLAVARSSAAADAPQG